MVDERNCLVVGKIGFLYFFRSLVRLLLLQCRRPAHQSATLPPPPQSSVLKDALNCNKDPVSTEVAVPCEDVGVVARGYGVFLIDGFMLFVNVRLGILGRMFELIRQVSALGHGRIVLFPQVSRVPLVLGYGRRSALALHRYTIKYMCNDVQAPRMRWTGLGFEQGRLRAGET